jgi:transcriptional regulator with XRE-family HTH domain
MGAPLLVPRAQRQGIVLWRLRNEAGLTVAELARRAGVAPNTILTAERGLTIPTCENATRIADVLGVDRTDIWDRPGQFRPDEDDGLLRRRRHDLGLSSREAAAKIGVSRSALLRAENGGSVFPRNARRIADFYGLPVTEVVAIRMTTGDEDDE